MARKIFTIVAAHPVDVSSHELPRVRVDTFLVEGESLQAAFSEIAGYTGIVGATEVFGIECSCVMLTPSSKLQREEQLSQWEHWSGMARRGETDAKWCLLAEGEETFRQRCDRQFIERNPQFA
ncbi:hypothetical protein P245_20940 [Comamonas thiooxydans]|uniref:Uncharacterized protein n=1 Tax=Comamonas thiooxydans TaxID=363952 RepID=A0A0E3B9W0_9BURK|nr:hypothetical protein [Comamonas thiooxydans]KGG86187.1 hypothetical protein P245_20940 [Comamonas thiooxydans]